MTEISEEQMNRAMLKLMRSGQVIACHMGTTNPLTASEFRYCLATDLDFTLFRVAHWAAARYEEER